MQKQESAGTTFLHEIAEQSNLLILINYELYKNVNL